MQVKSQDQYERILTLKEILKEKEAKLKQQEQKILQLEFNQKHAAENSEKCNGLKQLHTDN